ncbi:tryptophan synthase beta subunit-like PLP-dependent enzyme [Suillus paluster]|uniref:tryptophan synthase beta subunit-like PLP-dependent enzyme n=1 Tax=Suillus paluster TaxID=48578 RepID=UPI001B8608A6|nr:tryptophan synthase beta subunit-like PLP-dependent enzyme [Suillus paluster]KAG1756567.1 tryptophan synthase beta subunit-like PLP-dependent enzyme [Suillus paluster]
MRYFSTRGGLAELSFEEILSLFISADEISASDLSALVHATYNDSAWRHPDIAPLQPLTTHQPCRKYVLELFHGPTYAFKDVALQLLGNLFSYFLQRRNKAKSPGEEREKLTVVGATSGDTGSAAIYGLRGKPDVSIFILHPKGRVSPVQEAQMTTVTDENVHNIAVKGTFDDCQDIVKALFADTAFNAKHHLGAVNSINWARILAQTVYYFLSYFAIRRTLPIDAELQFIAIMPSAMGLPMAKLVIATNANDILTRFWKTGRYEKVDSDSSSAAVGGVVETLSPAMDILVSSNFERLLWYLAFENVQNTNPGGDLREKACQTVKDWMDNVKSVGRIVVPDSVLEVARRDFTAERVDDNQIRQTIREYYTSTPKSYTADPHTAVGLHVAGTLSPPPNTVQIILSTAHPAKFSEAVTSALAGVPGFDFDAVLPEAFKTLLTMERRVIDVERPDVELVKGVVEQFAVM